MHSLLWRNPMDIYIDSPALNIACTMSEQRATGPVWSRTVLFSSSPWLKLWNLSLPVSRSRVTLRLCDWGAGIDTTVHRSYRLRKFITCDWLKHRKLSLSRSRVSLRVHLCASMRYCVRTILTTFYHMHRYHYAATGDMVKSFIPSSNLLFWNKQYLPSKAI
jgi:hypothetical protein